MGETKIERHKQIWLTKSSYDFLRKLKRETIKNKEGKSMTEILDIVVNNYKNNGKKKEGKK